MVKRLLALSLLYAAGCAQDTKPITQLVLVSDSDSDVIDHIEFVVSSPTHATEMASALRAPGSAPRTLSLVHDDGPLGPLTVTARGLHGTVEVLERTHEVSFVADQTLVVPLDLYDRCIGITCPAGQTCAANGCTAQVLDANMLQPWTGSAPAIPKNPLDAAVADAAVDASIDAGERDAGERDAGTDLDAGDGGPRPEDASVDAERPDANLGDAAMTKFTACSVNGGDGGLYDLLSDPNHCGKCTKSCKVDMEQCSAGNCVKK